MGWGQRLVLLCYRSVRTLWTKRFLSDDLGLRQWKRHVISLRLRVEEEVRKWYDVIQIWKMLLILVCACRLDYLGSFTIALSKNTGLRRGDMELISCILYCLYTCVYSYLCECKRKHEQCHKNAKRTAVVAKCFAQGNFLLLDSVLISIHNKNLLSIKKHTSKLVLSDSDNNGNRSTSCFFCFWVF